MNVEVDVVVDLDGDDDVDVDVDGTEREDPRLPGERASGGAGGHAGASSESEGRRWRATRES